MNTREHWELAYTARPFQEQSWFQSSAEPSLAMIRRAGVGADDPVIDVGGGASCLVDGLLNENFRDITILDISSAAIDQSRQRLGSSAVRVQWMQQDILTFIPARRYSLWHDRAVFHFLTSEQDQGLYADVLRAALSRGGQLIIAAFALDGPERCSGLPVQRHDADSLKRALGGGFQLCEQEAVSHRTPAGTIQRFGYYRFLLG